MTTKTRKPAAAKLTKQEKAAQMELPGFRVVVRGTFGDKRVRRVYTVHAADDGAAALAAADNAKLLAGLDNVYLTVLPPLERVAA